MVSLFAVSCLAATPDTNQWQYIVTDKNGNTLYVGKGAIATEIGGNENSYVLMADALAIRPNGDGSFYKEVLSYSKKYGYMIMHAAIWPFRGYPSPETMMTPDWLYAKKKRVWHDVNGSDEWYQKEVQYIVKRADELGVRYK